MSYDILLVHRQAACRVYVASASNACSASASFSCATFSGGNK
jgi:hypothetical protein